MIVIQLYATITIIYSQRQIQEVPVQQESTFGSFCFGIMESIMRLRCFLLQSCLAFMH
jgi:hypothetical protein